MYEEGKKRKEDEETRSIQSYFQWHAWATYGWISRAALKRRVDTTNVCTILSFEEQRFDQIEGVVGASSEKKKEEEGGTTTAPCIENCRFNVVRVSMHVAHWNLVYANVALAGG